MSLSLLFYNLALPEEYATMMRINIKIQTEK